MVDTVIASHFDANRRRGDQLIRVEPEGRAYRYLVAKNADDGTIMRAVRAQAQKFIDQYSDKWNELRYADSLAQWNTNTHIVEGDDTNAKAANAADEQLSNFTGSKNPGELHSCIILSGVDGTYLQDIALSNIAVAVSSR